VAWFLAAHPDEQALVFEEVAAAFPAHGLPSLDTVLALPCLGRFVKEVMRLAPPVPVVCRTALTDDVLPGSGIKIPAGCSVDVSPFFTQRLPLIYGDDAEAFRPARWEEPLSAVKARAKALGSASLWAAQNAAFPMQRDAASAGRACPVDSPTKPAPPACPHAAEATPPAPVTAVAADDETLEQRIPPTGFMPFILGHRNCIGREFAWQEIVLTTAVMVRRFHWAYSKGQDPPRRGYGVTIMPKPALKFDVTVRED